MKSQSGVIIIRLLFPLFNAGLPFATIQFTGLGKNTHSVRKGGVLFGSLFSEQENIVAFLTLWRKNPCDKGN